MRIRITGSWTTLTACALGAALVCGVLEHNARATAATLELDKPFWYRWAQERQAYERGDVFVLGSSRVAMAVTEDSLSAQLGARLGRHVTVIDLGMGYATWTEHALGLQRLIETTPDLVRGAIVLLEAPSGRPPIGSWAQWYHPFSPGLLQMVMRGSDLGTLWQSPEPFNRKMASTLERLGSGSAMLRHRRPLREHAVARIAARVFGDTNQGSRADAIGGTKPGTLNLQNTRLRMVLQGIGLGRTASPGEPAPTETLVAAARRAGMVPLLLYVPEYPERWDYGGYAEDTHRPGHGRLGDVEMLHPEMAPVPSDYSDGVHLSPAAAGRYTDALAALLAGKLKGLPLRSAGGL